MNNLETKAYTNALNYLAIRMRTKKEIQKYLENKGYEKKTINNVLENLKKYINDELFAKKFIKSRQKYNPKGLKLIFYELKKKGVDENIINRALCNIDEKDMALSIIKKNKFRWKKLNKKDYKKKIFAFLKGRGFSFDTIRDL